MFWWRSRAASEPAREAVRLYCAQAWGEYPAVIHLGRQAVSYQVPGRRTGGTVRGRHRIRWMLDGAASWLGIGLAALLLAPVVLPVLLVMELLSARGVLDSEAWAFGRPELGVAGPGDSYAASLGDGARAAKAELWLAWTGAHVGIVTGRTPPYGFAWQGRTHDLQLAAGELRFADGSTVTFTPAGAELDRLRDHNGWP
jgi:hypothetical protein